MEPKAKPGQPTKYKQEYCQKLIEHMRNGLSFESFAAVIKVNQDTLYEWAKVHPEFSEAKKEAFAENLLFWEREGIAGLHGDKENTFKATVWIFNMKNRHKWRDKQPDESEVVINNNVGTLTDEQLDAKINKLLGEKK